MVHGVEERQEREDARHVPERAVEVGRRVVAMEIAGLAALSDSLGADFARAVRLLSDSPGRVIVTGMGKSGHIGRKIAATMASTGTPAQFVHPGEASHGDLGMITREDAVVALSKSGETSELADLLVYTRRFEIPLIAVTSAPGSTLARAADVSLVLPQAEEACTNGLAPTTSTTMALALGDALSIALMDRSGFSSADFRKFHPGGKLGAQLMAVRELMHTDAALPVIGDNARMADAIMVMTEKRFGCVGVTGPEGALAGIITDGDLRRHMSGGLLERAVHDVMTRDPKTVPPETLAAEAIKLMNASKITSLFVVEDGRPVGIVHVHDLLRMGVA
ncbi:MAG: SIS domain-containing protein [Alphaproteobacteria bacterium]